MDAINLYDRKMSEQWMDGKLHKVEENYDRDSKKLHSREISVDGLDQYEIWHPNGQLASTAYFLNGKHHGSWEEWNKDGILWHRLEYKDGREHGVSEFWFPDGQLASRRWSVNGFRQGLSEEWNADGKIRSWVFYVDSAWHGVHTYMYYHLGKVARRYYDQGEEITKEEYDGRMAEMAVLIKEATLMPEKGLPLLIAEYADLSIPNEQAMEALRESRARRGKKEYLCLAG